MSATATEDPKTQAEREKEPGFTDEHDENRSIEDLAGDPETKVGEEEDGQFVIDAGDGKRITLGSMIPRGTPIEYRVVMGSKSIGAKGGLIDPNDTNIMLLVRGVVGDVDVTFKRNEDESIEKAIVYVTIKPKTVYNAKTEAARVMLGGE